MRQESALSCDVNSNLLKTVKGGKSFKCELCSRQFQKASQLDAHVRRIHKEEKNNGCSVCGKAFFKKSDLHVHSLIHGNNYNCICRVCGRAFKHISNLNRHLRTHTGVKPYICSVCCKRYSQISALRQHCQTEQHKVKCNEEKKTDLQGNNEHELDECGDDSYPKEDVDVISKRWWFYCSVCGDRFQYMEQLRAHLADHVGKGDMMCKVCQTIFGSIADLMSHGCSDPNEVNSPSPVLNNSTERAGMGAVCNKAAVSSTQLNYRNIGASTTLHSAQANALGTIVIPLNDQIITPLSYLQLTQEQNGQLLLDNKEVLLTLNNNAYGVVLVNSDVTIVEIETVQDALAPSNDTRVKHVYLESREKDISAYNDMRPIDSLVTESRVVQGTESSERELAELFFGALI